MELPVYDDVLAAAKRIENEVFKTPIIESAWLNERAGGRVFLKPECLQHTGSFKFRGATNLISQIDIEKFGDGVVAFSSGNHAQGVAAAAQKRSIAATIVMPEDSPQIKLSNTRAYGAKVVTFDRATQDREEVARAQMAGKKVTLVPPFNHREIIAGQGTVALEIADWAQDHELSPDHLLVPTGGGGLVGGCGLVFAARFPKAQVHSVEPAGFDDYKRSLVSGKIEVNEKLTGSICDALLTPSSGEKTFAVNKDNLSNGLVVSDKEVAQAVRFAAERLKLVVEPGGAVGLASVLSNKIDCRDKTTFIVLSGGNIDAKLLAEIVGSG